jgi:hypothetical protein
MSKTLKTVKDVADIVPAPKLSIPFEPVPVRPRHDGWTIERQSAFVEKLADCGTITAAAKHVGMSRESVRKLRRRGLAFRDACDAAVDCGYAEIEEAAAECSTRGVARPIFYKGEQVGEWRHFDERLTMFLLRFRRRHRFGPEADTLPRLPAEYGDEDGDQQIPFDPEGEFEDRLDCLDLAPLPPDDDDAGASPEEEH